MFFVFLMMIVSAFAYLPQTIWGDKGDWRTAMRHGMGGAFVFTGIDHFVSLESRYLPMMPPYLAQWGVELVIVSGVLELAGAVGLLVPLAGWRLLKLPNLRPVAGLGLTMLLSVMVVANGHVAEIGAQVDGLSFGQNYSAVRPLLQPFIVLWALICSEAVFAPDRARDTGRAKHPDAAGDVANYMSEAVRKY
jgi:uncharacterized membrane protein